MTKAAIGSDAYDATGESGAFINLFRVGFFNHVFVFRYEVTLYEDPALPSSFKENYRTGT
ncbi:TPA: hypothetical protein EYP75_05690 [Candidatus Bathyarchaeota archaeon]|nr:hypothetical protein [Candidatus Bathyarchaeota archaeon]